MAELRLKLAQFGNVFLPLHLAFWLFPGGWSFHGMRLAVCKLTTSVCIRRRGGPDMIARPKVRRIDAHPGSGAAVDHPREPGQSVRQCIDRAHLVGKCRNGSPATPTS